VKLLQNYYFGVAVISNSNIVSRCFWDCKIRKL